MVIKPLPWYQTIPDLGIVGRMNTPEEFDKIGLPEDLRSNKVLDVGCNMGAFLLESLHRGAGIVHGVEPNDYWRWLAWGILTEDDEAKDADRSWVALYEDIDELPYNLRYDVTLLLSVTHVCEGITGQELIEKVWKRTRGLMIVEINHRLQKTPINLPEGAKEYGSNKDGRTVYHVLKNNP